MFAFDGDYVFIEQTATYSLLDHRATKDNKKWGRARNPWNLTRTPGGSSGGDAALVAMRCVPLAIGTDVAGSLRGPASFCGIVGFKPTSLRLTKKGAVRAKKVS